MKDYVQVTEENLMEIRKDSAKNHGRLVIGEPGFTSGWPNMLDYAEVNLFDRPVFCSGAKYLMDFYTKRGTKQVNGQPYQTNWENDRSYSLRLLRKPKDDSLWEQCIELFEKLELGAYEFKIDFQDVSGRGLVREGGIALYVPRDRPLQPALRQCFSYIIAMTNCMRKEQVPEGALDQIMKYVSKDLRDRKVMMKNVAAGLEADCVLGL